MMSRDYSVHGSDYCELTMDKAGPWKPHCLIRISMKIAPTGMRKTTTYKRYYMLVPGVA